METDPTVVLIEFLVCAIAIGVVFTVLSWIADWLEKQ
jgi:hypothetical protein